MSLQESGNKSVRSHSIHVVIARDYQRTLRARRLMAKFEQDYLKFDRKVASHVKWNERANQQTASQMAPSSVTNAQDRPAMTLEEFMVRERIKQDNISNAKKVANENIRRK